MTLAGNRFVNIALTLLIILDALLVQYVFFCGGVEFFAGGIKFKCTKTATPFLLLLALSLLKMFLARPDPFGRFARWRVRNRRTAALALVVTAVAALFRLHELSGHSIGPDEFFWVGKGRALLYYLRNHEFRKATGTLGHPGVIPAALVGASYSYLGKGTSPLSCNILNPVAAARLPGALAGVATCLLLYLLGRLVLGEPAAFWGAVLLALYPEHIAASRVTQLDAMLTLFFALTLLCYLVSAERPRAAWKIASAIFFGLALLTKTPAALLPIILLAWKAVAHLTGRCGRRSFWEASDLAWLGAGLAIYFSLYSRLWYDTGALAWARFMNEEGPAGIIALAINGAGRVQWVWITAAAVFIYALWRAAGGGRGRAHALFRAALLSLACLSFVRLFRKPMMNEVLRYAAISKLAQEGHVKYWMGKVVTAPPGWFYLFMLLIRTPPVMLALFIWGMARSCTAIRRNDRSAGPLLMCVIAAFGVIAAMSAGGKMGFRYLDPALPFLCLLGGVGAGEAAGTLASCGWGRRRSVSRGAADAWVGAIIAACALVPLLGIAPSYDIYFNSLIGGPAVAAEYFSTASGIGTKEAAGYLAARAGRGDSVYAVGMGGELRYYLERMPQPAPAIRVNNAKPPDADWLVVPISVRCRFPKTGEIAERHGYLPVYAVTKCGVDYVEIYRRRCM